MHAWKSEGNRALLSRAPDGNDSRIRSRGVLATRKLLLYCDDEIFHHLRHLVIHLFHPLLHIEDDGDARHVDAEIAREGQDEFEALQVLLGVHARVALSARRLEEAFTLVEPQRLRMNGIHLSDG